MQRLKLAPVQMLDWGLDKAEEVTKKALRKIPGHDRAEALVDRVRRRRPQAQQQQQQHMQQQQQHRGDSHGSHRQHRASTGNIDFYDDSGSRSGGRSAGDPGGMSGSSSRVVASVREPAFGDGEVSFADFSASQQQQQSQQSQSQLVASPQRQRGRPMYPSVFDSPQAGGSTAQQPQIQQALPLDDFADFFGSTGPEPQRAASGGPVPAPGAHSYAGGGGVAGSPSSLESQLDWFDDNGGSTNAPAASVSDAAAQLAAPPAAPGSGGFNMAAAVAAAASVEPVGYAERPLATWTVEEVCSWLEEVVQLPHHVDAFKLHTIDGFLLSRLVKDDLDDLGASSTDV